MKTTEWVLDFEEPEVTLCEKQEAALEVRPDHEPTKAMALETCAKRYHYWQLEMEALKARNRLIREVLDSDESLIEQKLAWYERQIAMALPPGPDSELVNDQVSVTYKQSERCEAIGPMDDIPLEYTRVKQELDKKKATEALKAGKQIPGVSLTLVYSLQVKPGGYRAKDNARKRAKARTQKVIEYDDNHVVENPRLLVGGSDDVDIDTGKDPSA